MGDRMSAAEQSEQRGASERVSGGEEQTHERTSGRANEQMAQYYSQRIDFISFLPSAVVVVICNLQGGGKLKTF